MITSGHLFAPAPPSHGETFETLFAMAGARIERIVSPGQAGAPGEWYDQPWTEWVALVAGEAALEIEGEAEWRRLRAGDWIVLPAHCRHRVAQTSAEPPAIWLAVHLATSA